MLCPSVQMSLHVSVSWAQHSCTLDLLKLCHLAHAWPWSPSQPLGYRYKQYGWPYSWSADPILAGPSPYQLQKLWSHLLPINTRPACLHTKVSFFCGCCDWSGLVVHILVFCDRYDPISVSWWQLLCAISHSFAIPCQLISQKFPLCQVPQRCYSSKYPMFLPIIEIDCFLGKRWQPGWVLRTPKEE